MLDINEWDDGKALFEILERNHFFSWDSREQFSIPNVQHIIAELVNLEPTKFIAISYVSYLLNRAFQRSNVSLSTAVLDSHFISFAADIRQSKSELDSYAVPKLDAFIESIQNYMLRLCDSRIVFRDDTCSSDKEWNNRIWKDEVILLARDAVIGTKLPLHWIYNNDQDNGLSQILKVLHADILMFSSLHDLELSIHNHELAYGFRYVTINRAEGALNAIVYTSPKSAFIMAELHWQPHSSTMGGGHTQYSIHLDGIDLVRQHFPKLNFDNKLTLAKEGAQVVGSIKTCTDSAKIWLLMLIELMGVKLESITPDTPSMSIKLLDATSHGELLPVTIKSPFKLAHKDIPTIAKEIGVDDSPIKTILWEIVDSLTLDDLLPRDNNQYLNIRCGERTATLTYEQQNDKKLHSSFVKLKRFPANHFGTAESTAEAINFVLSENLLAIINARLEDQWEQDFEEQTNWLQQMINKRKTFISKNVINWHETARELNPNTHNFNQCHVTGIQEGCRRLAVKMNTSRHRDESNPAIMAIPTLYKTNRRKEVRGIVTGNEYHDENGCDMYVVIPNSSRELMEVLNCKGDELPPLLRHWQRWDDHGRITYPWRSTRGQKQKIAVFSIYY